MRRIKIVALGLGLLCVAYVSAPLAKEAVPMAMDPALEKRVNDISSELRCLVCQNQTIADSHADLAIDLKNQVRDMVQEGKTQDQIVDYMVQRYGDFVRYRPALKGTTLLLWTGPFLFLLIGIVVLVMSLRKRRRLGAVADAPLSEEEQARLAQLMGSEGEKNQS